VIPISSKTSIASLRMGPRQTTSGFRSPQAKERTQAEGDAAKKDADKEASEWLKAQEGALNRRYERELMNPKEGLALGSISSIVMPTDLRKVLGENLRFLLRHYKPSPMGGPQREFH